MFPDSRNRAARSSRPPDTRPGRREDQGYVQVARMALALVDSRHKSAPRSGHPGPDL